MISTQMRPCLCVLSSSIRSGVPIGFTTYTSTPQTLDIILKIHEYITYAIKSQALGGEVLNVISRTRFDFVIDIQFSLGRLVCYNKLLTVHYLRWYKFV
jgi:hypothetical protein